MTIHADRPARVHQWVLRHDDMEEKLVLEHLVDGEVSIDGQVSLRHPALGEDSYESAVRLLFDAADSRAGFSLSWFEGSSPTIVAVSEEVER